MAFTTYAALLVKMLDDLDSGQWRYQSYTVRGETTTYTSLKDFREFLGFVEMRAGIEGGTFKARTLGRQGGRSGSTL